MILPHFLRSKDYGIFKNQTFLYKPSNLSSSATKFSNHFTLHEALGTICIDLDALYNGFNIFSLNMIG